MSTGTPHTYLVVVKGIRYASKCVVASSHAEAQAQGEAFRDEIHSSPEQWGRWFDLIETERGLPVVPKKSSKHLVGK